MAPRDNVQRRLALFLLSIVLLASHALALTDIAGWEGLRGAQIQSKLVLEGGLMTNGSFSDGKWTDTAIVQHSYGVYYQIDLTKSFDTTNQSTDEYLIPGLPETSNTQAPNYVAGGIFYNDYQFYTFGGLADKPPIGLSTVILGSVFPSNPSVSRFDQGVSPNQQTDGVSDNITSGAYASSPDQGLGFYFSGMVSATRAALEYNSDDTADNHPTVTSPTFIKVDMTTPNDAIFQSMNWPADMVPRAEGALVWLPYGKNGVLVAIGGVEVPGDRFLFPPEDTQDGPFMTELAIYDIDADEWHTQQTLGDGEEPTQLASFCTVVVPTQDGKSHEIFVYGGYDGTYTSADPDVRDDVWVLSVPAFQWTKVKAAASGSTHGRQGNVCFSPNPTTLITIGGTNKLGGSLTSETIIDVLDLNTLEWTGAYNASSNMSFNLPDAVVKQLNYPSATGPGDDAQVTGLNSTLDDLFSTPYQGEVKTYYPYSNGTQEVEEEPKHHSDKKWKVPVIATLCSVGGVAIIAAIVFCCLRRHRKNQKGVQRTQRTRKNVFSWLGKSAQIDPEAEKSNASGDTAVESNPESFNQKGADGQVHEAPSSVTSPVWTNVGTAAGSHERYEIMDQPQRDPASARSPQFSSRSLSQDQIMSATSFSRFSEGLPTPQNTRTVAYELPNEKSEEDLSKSLTAGRSDTPDERNAIAMSSATTERALSPSDMDLSSPVLSMRSLERPGHQRNISSLSSDLPTLPPPNPEEDVRRSRHIDVLPDIPASPQSTEGEGHVVKQ